MSCVPSEEEPLEEAGSEQGEELEEDDQDDKKLSEPQQQLSKKVGSGVASCGDHLCVSGSAPAA